MKNDVNETSIVAIIASAGDAKSYAYQAIDKAEEGDLEEAKALLKQGQQVLLEGHRIHTDLIKQDVTDGVNVTMLLVHASNHLSTAELSLDFAERIIKIYERSSK